MVDVDDGRAGAMGRVGELSSRALVMRPGRGAAAKSGKHQQQKRSHGEAKADGLA